MRRHDFSWSGSGPGGGAGPLFWCLRPPTNLAPACAPPPPHDPGPALGSTSRRTPPCRPPETGAHEEETARHLEVSPPVRTCPRSGGTEVDPKYWTTRDVKLIEGL